MDGTLLNMQPADLPGKRHAESSESNPDGKYRLLFRFSKSTCVRLYSKTSPPYLPVDTASGAFDAAMRCCTAGMCRFVFCCKERLIHQIIQMIPGKNLLIGTLPVGIKCRIQSAGREGGFPFLIGKALAPAVKFTAAAPCRFNDLSQAAIPSCQNRFQQADLIGMPAYLDFSPVRG